MDLEEEPASSAAAMKMESEPDTQPYYGTQADHNSHFSQPLESPSVATSVATSAASLGGSASPADHEDKDAHNQSSLHAANDSDVTRKRTRKFDPISRDSDTRRSTMQETLASAFSSTTTLDTRLIHDTTEYLQMILSLITAPERYPLEVLQLSTQLLLHRYKDIIAMDATDRHDVMICTPAQVQPVIRCMRCIAEHEDSLYD
ncbi:hypothetical protein N7448_011039 [Penicillium atrosanguineum]|nr:hypothetical protein N7448_011039 [Penicillium atrosanguineum]